MKQSNFALGFYTETKKKADRQQEREETILIGVVDFSSLDHTNNSKKKLK